MNLVVKVCVIFCFLSLVLISFVHSESMKETSGGQKILKSIPAAHKSTVWEIMLKNHIILKESMIDVISFSVPSQSIGSGDIILNIYFDTIPPSSVKISKEATNDLHAEFIKHKGSEVWEPGNGWARWLVEDRMPWK